jgi:hypothetical protein
MFHSSFSCANSETIKPKSKISVAIKHTSMDQSSFKAIIKQSKDDLLEYRRKNRSTRYKIKAKEFGKIS